MEKLKKQKAKLLDDVMETETYKVAKELLDDFATDAEKRQLNVRLFFDASQSYIHQVMLNNGLNHGFVFHFSNLYPAPYIELYVCYPI